MHISEINILIPLIFAGSYTILLIIAFTQRGQQERQARWLLAFLIISILWEFLIYFAQEIPYPPNLPAKALLIGTTLLGVTTAVFVNWSQQRRWILTGGLAIAAVFLLDILLPTQTISIPLTSRTISYSDLFTTITWLSLSAVILSRTWRDYRHTTFPWHANRLLFWLIVLILTFIGEALLFFHFTGLTLTGQILRFIGVIGLTHAVSSHRIIDVRARSQNALTYSLITIVSALPLTLIILFLQKITDGNQYAFVYTIITVTVSFILYNPIRRFVEKIFHKLIIGEGIDTRQVLRHYSQDIYQILDVQQLSQAIIGALSKLLEFKHGALMLVSNSENGYKIESFPCGIAAARQEQPFPPNSIFIKSLAQQHQPLLQYELDFNRDYTNITPPIREWINQIAMDVYVPINSGNTLEGLIAIGPKTSGVPYQPRELELMQILADQTVVALQNARLYSELERQNDKIRRLNTDLTSQNERLGIMDRVKSDFITIASHELRTPLTQVKGYTDILHSMNEEAKTFKREDTRKIISHIVQAGNRLDTLITDMLDASQLDTDGFHMLFSESKLEMIVSIAAESLKSAIDERHITWKTQGLGSLPSIYADSKRLVQAFTNLIGNAIKYTPDFGAVSLLAELVPSENEVDEYIEIVLTDQGIGIDSKFHDLIFENFFRVGDPQLHSTGSTKFMGAGPGLGLPIAKGVIEGHGGHIWVESRGEDEGRLPGSQFHILLPVRPPHMTETNDATMEQANLLTR